MKSMSCLRSTVYQLQATNFLSINGQKRSFQHSRLSKYDGLVYSESHDGSYCKFCVLFWKCECSVNEFGVLVARPFTNFKKASEKFGEHFIHQTQKGKRFHQCAVQKLLLSFL